MADEPTRRPTPRLPAGMQDAFAADVVARQRMIDTVCAVYSRFGFEPLETSAIEYLDVLGKYLPDSDGPDGGVFAFKDDDGQWLSLRYDLTAPLSRVVAQHGADLPTPFRRFQVGPVWRREKPGPGRFRQFYQCDFDTVGTASAAADAEVCAVLATSLEALGIARSDFQVRVNNRKILNGVLESIGIEDDEKRRVSVLRAIDKLDRLGLEGVEALLGEGRKDSSGDFTSGAGLSSEQTKGVLDFIRSAEGGGGRADVCKRLHDVVGNSRIGHAGIEELEQISVFLDAMGLTADVVPFDPTVIRGLGYYTGPVFEAVLTFKTTDEDGASRNFGSVAGGGRYDDLVQRFTGTEVPATGASIGVDRLLNALRVLGAVERTALDGPVVVTAMDRARLVEYQQMVSELRHAGVAAELYLGDGSFRVQMKYADKRRAPLVVIAGDDEFKLGQVAIKDLRLGSELAKGISDRQEWRSGKPAQRSVNRGELVASVREMLER